jgi:hypothetical protein
MELNCVQEFDTEQLHRISKISGLSTMIQVYQKTGLPLYFNSSVGTLGKIAIYTKDKKQIQEEDIGGINDDENDDENSE